MGTFQIVVNIISGAFGMGYFVYGKKQNMMVPLFCGVGLMVYPMLVNNDILLVLIGVVLLAAPYFIRY